MTLSEAKIVESVLQSLEGEIAKRDRGDTASHEYDKVSIVMTTDAARVFVAAIRNALG